MKNKYKIALLNFCLNNVELLNNKRISVIERDCQRYLYSCTELDPTEYGSLLRWMVDERILNLNENLTSDFWIFDVYKLKKELRNHKINNILENV